MVHARDAAQAKIAAIGSVNPRAGGVVNGVIQASQEDDRARAADGLCAIRWSSTAKPWRRSKP